MAVTADKVVVELELKDGDYTAKVKRAEAEFTKSQKKMVRSAEEAERDIERALGGLPESLKARYRDLGASIGSTLMGVSRSAQLAFGAITAYSLKLAADAAEIESAFEVAFGSATISAKAFSEQLADTAGRDSVALREQMTRLQLVLTGTGVAAADAAKMVQALTAIGVDAGSLFNTSDAVALQKIISGITGEAEPLKAFGVVLTEAAVKAELLRLGFKGNAEQATEAQKSIARTNLILKGLNVAQGDAARTADSAANTTKRMTAEFNKAARELGTQLLPAMTKLFGATTDVLKAFNDLPGGVQVAGLAFLGLIAAAGPIAGLLAGLGRVIKLARDTKLALAALGGSSAAAGAGAGAGLLGGTAVVGGGLLLSQGSFAKAPTRDEAAVQRDLKFNRDNLARLEAEGASARRLERARGRVSESLAELSATQKAAADAYAAEAAAIDTSIPGGFDLGGSLTGAGGNKKKGKTSEQVAKEAQARARLLSDLTMAAKLEEARLAQDVARVRELEREAEIVARVRQLKDAGFSAEKAAEISSGVQARLDESRLQDRLRLAEIQERGLTLTIAELNENFELARSKQRQIEYEGLLAAHKENEASDTEAIKRATEDIAALDEARLNAANRYLRTQSASHALRIAELSGNEKLANSLRDQEAILQRTNELRQQGLLSIDAARRQATEEVTAERSATKYGEQREFFASTFSEGIRAAMAGDLQGFLASQFGNLADVALKKLGESLFDSFANAPAAVATAQAEGAAQGLAFSTTVGPTITASGATAAAAMGTAIVTSGTTVAALIAQAMTAGNTAGTVASIFGGGRAGGGPVRAGFTYDVGESGREKFVAPSNGYIIPNMKNANASPGMSGVVRIQIGEGEMFSARVTEIAGPLSVQAATTGVAYSQDQAINAQKRRGQSFV